MAPDMPVVRPFPPDFPNKYELLQEHHGWHTSHRLAPEHLSDDDRSRYNLGLLRIGYPAWTAAVDAAMDLVFGPKVDRQFMMIGGRAGLGKTSLALHIAMLVWDRVLDEDGSQYETQAARYKVCPVVAVKAPRSDAKDHMTVLLGALGVTPRGTAQSMLDDFAMRCREHKIRLVIIDDVHAVARNANMVTFYRLLIGLVPATLLFTAVDFEQSPIASFAKEPDPNLRDLLEQNDDRHDLPTMLTPIGRVDREGLKGFSAALRAQSSMLRLRNQDSSDLLTPGTARALLASNNYKLAKALTQVAKAGAKAVGKSERVGAAELGLRVPKPLKQEASA